MNNLHKILGFLFAVLFVWAAAVQYNDPDAVKWYVIYGVGALASILFALGRLKMLWALFLAGFFIGFSVFSWPSRFEGVTIGEGDIENIEKGREALGLLLSAIIMLAYGLLLRKTKKAH